MMINPVFRRELRTVLRSWKIFIAIMLYILCLTGIAILFLMPWGGNYQYNGFNPRSVINTYYLMAGFQLGLIMLLVPALTGGSISGERERQTWDLILVTKMSTFSIIFGKLTSSLLIALLMILATLPVFGIIMYYGGVSFGHLIVLFSYFLLTAMLVGSLAIFFSTFFKKTIVAIIVTYIVLLVLCLGTLIFLYIFPEVIGSINTRARLHYNYAFAIMSFNPFMGFISIIDSQFGMDSVRYIAERATRYANSGRNYPVMPLWVFNITVNSLLSIVLLAVSALIIRPVMKSRMYK